MGAFRDDSADSAFELLGSTVRLGLPHLPTSWLVPSPLLMDSSNHPLAPKLAPSLPLLHWGLNQPLLSRPSGEFKASGS